MIYKTAYLIENKEDITVNTSFFMNVLFYQNKFNFVNLENIKINSTLYFDNNTVQGSLTIGKQELSNRDADITFPMAISMTGNKIKNAMFYNLYFEAPICLHHNNFDGDLTFRDTAHKMTMDFTGCFVGGSFVFHNTNTSRDKGSLILDNLYVHQRI